MFACSVRTSCGERKLQNLNVRVSVSSQWKINGKQVQNNSSVHTCGRPKKKKIVSCGAGCNGTEKNYRIFFFFRIANILSSCLSGGHDRTILFRHRTEQTTAVAQLSKIYHQDTRHTLLSLYGYKMIISRVLSIWNVALGRL